MMFVGIQRKCIDGCRKDDVSQQFPLGQAPNLTKGHEI